MSTGPSTDPNKVRRLVYTRPLGQALAHLDGQLTQAGEPATFELAEDTYSWLKAVSLDELTDTTTTKATFYVNRPLAALTSAAPDSAFAQLSEDTDYDAHELVYPDVTLRLKFDTRHQDRTVIETEFTAISITVPTWEAYSEATVHAFTDHFGTADQDRSPHSP